MSPALVAPATPDGEFRALFEAQFAYVCRALRRLGVSEADLPDVTQELFVAVHKSLATYDPSRPVRPWLFSFAVRFAANYRRLARSHGHVPVEVLDRQTKAASAAAAEARDLVLRALEHLPFERRTVFVMHDLEGFGAPEIAAEVGAPLNTVYSRLRLARDDFRRAVSALQEKGGRA